MSILRRTNAGGQVCASIWLRLLLLAFLAARVSSCFVGMFWDFGSRSLQLHVLERLWVCSQSVGVLSYAFEGLDRHVLAGSLFSGTGEQATGRVDVPARTISSKPQLQKKLLLFVSSSSHWVERLMSSSLNTRPLSHGSSSTLHSSLGSVWMLSTWSGKARCFGMETRWNVLGLCGTRNCTCVPISVAVWVWYGQTAPDSWAMGVPVL